MRHSGRPEHRYFSPDLADQAVEIAKVPALWPERIWRDGENALDFSGRIAEGVGVKLGTPNNSTIQPGGVGQRRASHPDAADAVRLNGSAGVSDHILQPENAEGRVTQLGSMRGPGHCEASETRITTDGNAQANGNKGHGESRVSEAGRTPATPHGVDSGATPDGPTSKDDRAARFARALAAGMIEAGLLALGAALLIAADPAPHFHDQVVTNPPLTGR